MGNRFKVFNFIRRILLNAICYLWRHKVIFNDNGLDTCIRCGKHEYYDSDFHNGKPIFKIAKYFVIRYDKIRWWYRKNILRELPF